MANFKTILTNALLCAGTLFPATQINAAVPFLEPGPVGRSAGLAVNPAAISALRETTDTISLTGVPLVTGAVADFLLEPARIFTDDVNIVRMEENGTTTTVTLPEIKAWYGTAPRNPELRMFISADKSLELDVMIMGDEQSSVTVINRNDITHPGAYQIQANALPKTPLCSDPLALLDTPPPTEGVGVRGTATYNLELTLDVGHDLFQKLGRSNEVAIDYLVDLVGASNLIYRRDLQLNLVVNNLFLWPTPDPFLNSDRDSPPDPAYSTYDQLLNYMDYVQTNRSGYSWDLTHLLAARQELGGLANLSVLRNLYAGLPHLRSGVSNVYGTDRFPDINTYYWDTMVLTHELGHNVGSPHTHCYTPPVDCCVVDPGCSGCVSENPVLGTIMSYCHLKSTGIVMAFHERSIALMRPLIESSPLLSVHTPSPDINIFGLGNLAVSNISPHQASTIRSVGVGLPVTQTFTIRNSGTANLVLPGIPPVVLSGSPMLTVTAQPAVTSLAPGQQTTFAITYSPQTGGQASGAVAIATNVAAKPVINFPVFGQIVQVSPPVSATYNGPLTLTEGPEHRVPFEITGLSGWVTDVDVRFNGTNCAVASQTGLQHPYVGDLVVTLESPVGTRVTLMSSPGPGQYGSAGANFCNTLLDDSALVDLESITAAGAPYSGSYRPLQSLALFNGERANGIWTLIIRDPFTPDAGVLHSASVIVRGETVSEVDNWTLY